MSGQRDSSYRRRKYADTVVSMIGFDTADVIDLTGDDDDDELDTIPDAKTKEKDAIVKIEHTDNVSIQPDRRDDTGLGQSILAAKRNMETRVGGQLGEEVTNRLLEQQRTFAAAYLRTAAEGLPANVPSRNSDVEQAGGAEEAESDDNSDLFVQSTSKRKRATTNMDENDVDTVTQPKKARKVKAKKPAASTVPSQKKGRKKNQQVLDINNLSTDLFGDVAASEGIAAQPTFGEGLSAKKDALQQLLDSVPGESKAVASRDKRTLDKAISVFGQRTVKPAANGLWSVKGMLTCLRPHQILGTAFMLQREREEDSPQGGILADQMGLGKTLMTLACIVSERGKVIMEGYGKTTLVVATGALIHQWQQEIDKHCKASHANKYGIAKFKQFRSRDEQGSDPVKILKSFEVIFATYEEVTKSYPLREPPEELVDHAEREAWWKEHYEKTKGILHQMDFFRVCLDEAHLIRNAESRRFKACLALRSKHTWCLTGTPCINETADLWSLLKIIKAPKVGSLVSFREKYCDMNDPESVQDLTRLLSRYMLRRTHADRIFDARIVDLPNAHAMSLQCHFNRVERRIYDIVEKRFRQRINELSSNNVFRNSVRQVWTMILRLRQLTAHPLMVQGTMLDLLEREDLESLNDLAQDERDFDKEGAAVLIQLRRILEDQSRTKNDETTLVEHVAAPIEGEIAACEVQANDGLGRHGLHFHFKKYVENLEKTFDHDRVVEELFCVFCKQSAEEAHVTSCFHVYCKQCLVELQDDAANDGHTGAACFKCGQVFQDSNACDDIVEKSSGETALLRMKKAQRKADKTAKDWLDIRGQILPSAKTIAVKAQVMLWRDQEPGVKIIIYTQWLPMVRIFESICKSEGWKYCKYTGEMSQKARRGSLYAFGSDPDKNILLASLKCGGLGLNLTMASRVICVDPWWNKAIEQQAFCRVYRIGQERETSLLSLWVKDTIDERMQAIKDKKQINIDAMVDENEARKKLSLEDMLSLFGRVKKDSKGRHVVVGNDTEDDS